jgi:magnesium chelatase family protein
VRSALRSCLPEKVARGRIVVNLSPAWRRKAGAGYDLAIAMALLAAGEMVKEPDLAHTVLLGELGLDGRLRGVAGVLPSLMAASRLAFKRAIVPRDNATEAGIVEAMRYTPRTLSKAAMELVRGGFRETPVRTDARDLLANACAMPLVDLAEVGGQRAARRALEVSAAGGHHVLMIGPPGAGKTMLARRLPTILPPFELTEAIETTSIHSIAGLNHGGSLPRDASLSRATPQHVRRRHGRRRLGAGAGRDQPRTQRRAVPRRAAGVRSMRPQPVA